MSRRSPVQLVIAAAWLCALSCSLVVDTSEVSEGCGSEGKICDGKCVQRGDPAYGCSEKGCDPCRLINAIPSCRDDKCVIDACLLGFDCPDPERPTGCLINVLADSDNCGACGNGCDSGFSCRNGTCELDPVE